jgi:hypothetical protein
MPTCPGQTTRSPLRMLHPEKVGGSAIQIRGIGVRIGKPCALVDGVHQVGTVIPSPAPQMRIARDRNDGQAILFRQCRGPRRFRVRLGGYARRQSVLRPGACQSAENQGENGFETDCNSPSIVMGVGEGRHITPVLGRLRNGKRCRDGFRRGRGGTQCIVL